MARNTCSDLNLADLSSWKSELASTSYAVQSELATLSPLLQKLTSGVTSATLTITVTGGKSLQLTWNTTGEEGNLWSIMLITPPPPTVDITAAVDTANKLITFYLQSTSGIATTDIGQLEQWINADPTISTYITASIVPSVDPILALSPTFAQFQGGNSAPLATTTVLLNNIFSAVGITPQEALQRVGRASTSDDNLLASTSNIIVLTPPKVVRVEGTNLINLRSLWTLLGANATATPRLLLLLSENTGTPIVVWVETITTTIAGTSCAPTPVTTITNNVLALNAKTTNSNAICYIFWLETININASTLAKLKRCGVTDSNLTNAMSEGPTTLIIENKTILNEFVASDQNYLLGLDIPGITSITYDTAIDEVAAAKFGKNSSFVPQLQLPSNSIRSGINPTDTITGLTLTGSMIAAIDESPCLGAGIKGDISTFISMISASFDTAAATLNSILDTARVPINKASEVLDTINTFLYGRLAEATTYILGLDLAGVIGDIDMLIPMLPTLSDKLSWVLDKIVDILDLIIPNFCKIQKALQNLMHIETASIVPSVDPILALSPTFAQFQGGNSAPLATTKELLYKVKKGPKESAETIRKKFTDVLDSLKKSKSNYEKMSKAFGGITIQKLLLCIEIPLDVIGMLAALEGKVDRMLAMIQGFSNNIIQLKIGLAAVAKYFDDEVFKEYTTKCESNSFNALSKRIKSSFI